MQSLDEVIALYKMGNVGPGLRDAAARLSREQLRMASTDVLILLDSMFGPIRSADLRSSPTRLAGLRAFVDCTEGLKALFSVSDRAELVFWDPAQGQAAIDFIKDREPIKIERTPY